MLKSKYVKPRAWFFEYDRFGRAKTVTDPTGNVVSIRDERIEPQNLAQDLRGESRNLTVYERVERQKLVVVVFVNDREHATFQYSDVNLAEIGTVYQVLV